MNGTIFDIKEFSIHDGPGARVTVFLKGCPLRCRWCHNPEGLIVQPQLMYKENLCSHCGRCRIPCEHPECRPFDRCIHACANGCLSVSGRDTSAAELAEKLTGYRDFFRMTGGGLTISGGEPLLQPDFVCELIAEARKRIPELHVAIQTSGYAPTETYRRVIGAVDYVMQDLKLADPTEHLTFTGVSNEWILDNVRWLQTSGKEFVFRIPLIPGIVHTPHNLAALAAIAQDAPVELLKYNTLAGAKYGMLGMTYPLDVPEDASPSMAFGKTTSGNTTNAAANGTTAAACTSQPEPTSYFQNAGWG